MTQTWKVFSAFTGIFVAGAVAGGIVALRVGEERVAEQPAVVLPAGVQPTPPASPPKAVVTPDTFTTTQIKRITAQLGLSSTQSGKINPIITITGDKIRELSQKSAAATNELLKAMAIQVSAELTPEQRKKFDESEKRRQDAFNSRQSHPTGPAFGNRRGSPGGPGGDHVNGSTGSTSETQRMNRRGAPQGDQPQPSQAPAPADQAPVP
jgi:hypothetical protein